MAYCYFSFLFVSASLLLAGTGMSTEGITDQETMDASTTPSLSVSTGARLDEETNGSQISLRNTSGSEPRRQTRGRSVSGGRGRAKRCKRCMRDFLAVGNRQFCGLPDCAAPSPAQGTAATGSQDSRKRQAASPPVSNGSGAHVDEKRMKKTASAPQDPLPTASSTVCSARPPDLGLLKQDLNSLNERDLRTRVREILDAADYYRSELVATKAKFDEYRIKFADKIFEAFPFAAATSGGAAAAPPEQTTIVATMQDDKMGENVTTEVIDKILGAETNGPVPQIVQPRGHLVYMSFADAVQSGKARSILESDRAGSSLFQSIDSRKRLFPAVARSVNLADMEALRSDTILRNEFLGGSLEAVRPLFRGRDGVTGHVKLLFSSASRRDDAIRRGKIYVSGRRVVVTSIDWNKEVRRCFNCQRYGHIARLCSSDPACGRCAGAHAPGQCNSAPRRCANCAGAHIAGDPSCAEQIKAVRRLRARLDE